MKHCVISFASNDKQFPAGVKRLEQSLKRVKFDGDFVPLVGNYPVGCPVHLDSPYAFKPFCFMEAKKRGYELILWIDSSGVVIRPLDFLFNEMEKEGYVLFKMVDTILGEWCSDEALVSLGVTREEALRIPGNINGVIGLNMRNEKAIEFLNRWYEKALDGVSFRGTRDSNITYRDIQCNRNQVISKHPRVRGHRRAATAAGVIANQLDMKLIAEKMVGRVIPERPSKLATTILICRDVKGNAPIKSLNRVYFYKYISQLRYLLHRAKARIRFSRKKTGLES